MKRRADSGGAVRLGVTEELGLDGGELFVDEGAAFVEGCYVVELVKDDEAWAEAALALRAEHTRVLADLDRARAAAAGPAADTSALLPDLLAQ